MPFIGYNWTNASNLARAAADAPNANTGGSFWVAILYFIWIIAVALLTVFGWEVALLVGSLGCTIIGVFLVYYGAILWEWLVPFVAIDLFMFIYIMWSSSR